MIDGSLFRKDFPMLQTKVHGYPLIYLDTAATAQKPKVMIETLRDFYENHYATVHRSIYFHSMEATSRYNQVREKVKNFIHAKKVEEIIFTKGTTESINLLAHSFGKSMIQEGDEILLLETEHHSNIVPWQVLALERGAKLKFIPVNDQGELCFNAYKALLNKRTKLVVLAHISNSLGVVQPIKEVIQEAKLFGAKVFVDAAQSASHLQIDVQDLDVDFLAFSGHKMYGPNGIGILYGKYELLEKLSPYQTGSDMIQKVTLEGSTYSNPPLKFEAGTPMIAEVIAFGASLDYITQIGLKEIELYEKTLLVHLMQGLKQIQGIEILGDSQEKAAIVSFIVEGVHPLDLATLLDLKGVAIRTGHLCAQPALHRFAKTSLSRVSLGLYNTHDEIDQFIHYLQQALPQLKR